MSTKTMRVKSVSGRETSSEFRVATSIGAAVTRRKARSFMRKGRGNSIPYRRRSRPLTGLHALRHGGEKVLLQPHLDEVTGRDAPRSRNSGARYDPRQRM